MKRDMDLVRSILLTIESQPDSKPIPFLQVEGYDSETVAYHCEIMYQNGLLLHFSGQKVGIGEYGFWEVSGITWEGYDYLDKIRDNTIWDKTKAAIKKKGLPLVIDTIKTVSTAFITASTEGLADAILKSGGII